MQREFCRYLDSAGKLQILTLYLYRVCARQKTLLRRIMTRVKKCSALKIAFQSLRFETKRCKIYTRGHFFQPFFHSLKGAWSRLQTKLIFCNFDIYNAQIIHFNKQPHFERHLLSNKGVTDQTILCYKKQRGFVYILNAKVKIPV